MGSIEKQLEDALEELEYEREKVAVVMRRLESAIDILADLGILDNTPQCRRMYLDGEREVLRG